MNDRERWIVYPLLFLALGASLRDKLLKQSINEQIKCSELYCDELICRQVQVIDEQGRVRTAIIGGAMQSDSLQATVIDAKRFQTDGKAIGAPSKSTIGFPMQQLPQVIEMLKRAGVVGGTAAQPPATAPPATAQPLQQPATAPAAPAEDSPVDSVPESGEAETAPSEAESPESESLVQ